MRMGENGKGYMLSLLFFPGGQFGTNPLVWANFVSTSHSLPLLESRRRLPGQIIRVCCPIMLQVDQVIEPAAAGPLPRTTGNKSNNKRRTSLSRAKGYSVFLRDLLQDIG